MKAHPIANIFPLMKEDELEELAADIKANGLQSPIVVGDYEGKEVIIDGRNRWKACKMAGVEPVMVRFKEDDMVAFIVSANITRRHMTKGQQAMAIAMIYPEPEQGKRTDLFPQETGSDFHKATLSKARAVLKYAPELGQKVVSGDHKLNDAYKEAKARKDSAWTPEQAKKRAKIEAGKSVVINLDTEPHLVQWARSEGLLVEVDRRSAWGNPFLIDDDGDRAEVIHKFATHYLPHKTKLMAQIDTLKGKALGCHCSPEPCHADILEGMANED